MYGRRSNPRPSTNPPKKADAAPRNARKSGGSMTKTTWSIAVLAALTAGCTGEAFSSETDDAGSNAGEMDSAGTSSSGGSTGLTGGGELGGSSSGGNAGATDAAGTSSSGGSTGAAGASEPGGTSSSGGNAGAPDVGGTSSSGGNAGATDTGGSSSGGMTSGNAGAAGEMPGTRDCSRLPAWVEGVNYPVGFEVKSVRCNDMGEWRTLEHVFRCNHGSWCFSYDPSDPDFSELAWLYIEPCAR